MVEYLKTKKGYFYKLLKNGEKKRISKEEYYEKKRKNKKMIGGDGKSEQEIIDEVTDKGKYYKWIRLGSKFGIIHKYLDRPYKYIDVNGKKVNVSYITSTYNTDPNVENIAVFEFCNPTKNTSFVQQNNYSIVGKNNRLYTAGLSTCCAIGMIIGNKKFMAHLDATTNPDRIINAIINVIQEENVDPRFLYPYIYAGSINSARTLAISKYICNYLGIPEENCNISYVCFMENVNI